MKVIWTPEAEQDRLDIWDYIAEDNPPAAADMDELFSKAASTCELAAALAQVARADVGQLTTIWDYQKRNIPD